MFRSRSGEVVQCFAESKHPILELSLPIEAEMLPVFNKQVSSRGAFLNTVLWTYSLVGDAGSTKFIIRRKLTVITTFINVRKLSVMCITHKMYSILFRSIIVPFL